MLWINLSVLIYSTKYNLIACMFKSPLKSNYSLNQIYFCRFSNSLKDVLHFDNIKTLKLNSTVLTSHELIGSFIWMTLKYLPKYLYHPSGAQPPRRHPITHGHLSVQFRVDLELTALNCKCFCTTPIKFCGRLFLKWDVCCWFACYKYLKLRNRISIHVSGTYIIAIKPVLYICLRGKVALIKR